MVEERGWNILNGNMEGDDKGEYTYSGPRGSTVIDYIITNVEAKEEIKKFTVEERVESDHMPLIAELYAGNKREDREGNQEERWRERRIWTEEGRREFEIELNKINFNRTEVNEMVEEMIEKINNAVQKEEVKIKKWKLGSFKWWNSNCTKKKREARKALRNWRRGKGDKEDYQKKRREYKKVCDERRRELQENTENEIMQLKGENQIWEYINKQRKKRIGISNKIDLKEWKDHFKTLLEGDDCKKEVGELEEIDNTEGEEEEEITEAEVKEQIRKLKKKKAAGEDKIENEAWIYGNMKIVKRITEIFNKVWKGEGFPERWKEGVISPIFKKGDREKVSNYRGITILNTAYKIYAMVLEKRLKEELEKNHIIPETQAGFRSGRSTIDNIFILNYVANREIQKKGGKLYTFFADLSAAFDKVDRVKLQNIMKKKEISKCLRMRIGEIYKETRNTIKANGEMSSQILDNKRGKTGMPTESNVIYNICSGFGGKP